MPDMLLERVLEPEVMDTEEEAREYNEMDHASVNEAFCDDLFLLAPDLSRTLDVGTGTALIPIALCRRAPAARVVAIDLATSMLSFAEKNVARAALSHAITVARVDAKALPYENDAFSCIISNSILHHIPEPTLPLKEMLRVIQPGGCIFLRDLFRPESDAYVRKLVDTYTGDSNDHQRALFDASLRAAFTVDEMRDIARAVGIPPHAVQVTSDRHWTLSFRRPSDPDRIGEP